MTRNNLLSLLAFPIIFISKVSFFLNDFNLRHSSKLDRNVSQFNFAKNSIKQQDNIGDRIVLINQSNSAIDFAYNNNLDDRIEFKLLPGKIFKIRSETPIFLIQTNKNQNFYLVNLNETVSVNLNSFKNAELTIKDNLTRNNELNFSKTMNEQLPTQNFWTISQLTQKYRNDCLKLDSIFETEYKLKNDFLENYKRDNPISTDFLNYIKAFFISHLLGSKLFFIGLQFQDKLPQSYKEYLFSLKKEIIDTPQYEKNVWTKKMQYNYIKFLCRNSRNEVSYRDSLYRNAGLLLSTASKYDVQFYIVKEELNSNQQSNSWFINDFVQKSNNLFYKDYLVNLLENNTLMNKAGKDYLLVDFKKRKLNYDSTLISLRGRLIYIDLWASWCLPCRKEIPFEEGIRSLYQNKPVSFLYIGIDRNLIDWQTACENENLTSTTNNYWMPNFEKSSFKNSYKVSTIPRYILLNKNGKVITADAPRPSDSDLKKLLDKYLNE